MLHQIAMLIVNAVLFAAFVTGLRRTFPKYPEEENPWAATEIGHGSNLISIDLNFSIFLFMEKPLFCNWQGRTKTVTHL